MCNCQTSIMCSIYRLDLAKHSNYINIQSRVECIGIYTQFSISQQLNESTTIK